MRITIFGTWKKQLHTKSIMFLPTIAFLKNPKSYSLDIIWLIFDVSIEFKRT